MRLKTLYSLKTKSNMIKNPELQKTLYKILDDVKNIDNSIFVVDCWSAPFTNNISLVTSELELALKLNNYDNVSVILASEDTMRSLLKKEWVREYFAKQMPDFMLEEIVGLIDGGEDPEEAWSYYIEQWLPNNKAAGNLIELQENT